MNKQSSAQIEQVKIKIPDFSHRYMEEGGGDGTNELFYVEISLDRVEAILAVLSEHFSSVYEDGGFQTVSPKQLQMLIDCAAAELADIRVTFNVIPT